MGIPTRLLISCSTRVKMPLTMELRVTCRAWKQYARLFSVMSELTVDVSVKEGRLRGTVEKNVDGGKLCAFRGIPYAKAPVNGLRFKDPEAAEAWTGVRDASKFGNKCAQRDMITQKITGSDDCLYLNVYTNDIRPATLLPVMFYIHGGGFATGSGEDDIYGADYLLKKDVVVVTFNYRVGVLGFLNLEDEVAPGNQGLKDQVMALRWVKENISNFGGDPSNVTIFGESAGGASVHYLALSPLANGLFHKAISQSGVATNPWASLKNPKRFGYRLAADLGLTSDVPIQIVDFLRTIDAEKLVEYAIRVTSHEENMQFVLPFAPAVDDKSPSPFMPQPPETAILSAVKVPYLLGYNRKEGLFLTGIVSMGAKAVRRYQRINDNFELVIPPKIMEIFKRENVSLKDIRNLYFGDGPITEESMEELAELNGDMHFTHGIYEVVKIQCEKTRTPTYLYEFSYDSGLSFMKTVFNITGSGATHADELPYLFYPKLLNTVGLEPFSRDSVEYKVVQYFTTMWTNFAKTGNPTPTTTELIPVTWKPVEDGPYYNVLNIDKELKMQTYRKGELRLEWKNVKNKL